MKELRGDPRARHGAEHMTHAKAKRFKLIDGAPHVRRHGPCTAPNPLTVARRH